MAGNILILNILILNILILNGHLVPSHILPTPPGSQGHLERGALHGPHHQH